MKTLTSKLLIAVVIYCAATYAVNAQTIDLKKELAKIEETRNGFMLAIKEKRYQDLVNFATADMQSTHPGTEDWNKMRSLGAERGTFPYDSIFMNPKETVIVSDSVAYDYGVSTVYFSDKDGKLMELHDTFLVILKKGSDGIWKLHREVASAQIKYFDL